MKLRRLFRQAAAAAVAGAMALSLCMPALAETWNISNQPGFKEVYSVTVTGTTSGRTVELSGSDENDESAFSEHTETRETVLSDSVATRIALNGRDAPVSVALDKLSIRPERESGSEACISTGGSASVDLRGQNNLTTSTEFGIRVADRYAADNALTLGGTGALNIRSRYGIDVGSGSFTLNGGSVDMAAAEGSGEDLLGGVSAGTITLIGGSIHAVIAPSIYYDEDYTLYHDALSAPGGIFIRGGSVDTGKGVLYADDTIRISSGKVTTDTLCTPVGLTISGGEVITCGFSAPDPIVLSGSAKVTLDNGITEEALVRFDTSGLTTDGYLRYKPNPLDTDVETDEEGYVVIRGKLEPQSGGDAGDASGDVGGALAAVAIGSAAVWGGYEVATRVILHKLLPEGAAIPKTQAELALLLWNTAGQPEPVNAPAFANVDDATAQAAQWCTEQGYLSGAFKPEKRVAKYNVIRAWNKAFPKAK